MEIVERPSKRAAFENLYKDGWVRVYLDARRPGVVLPARFCSAAQMLLEYGEDMPIPIEDLVIDDEGIRATLSFSQESCGTFVPWSAVYVIFNVENRGICYEEDVPCDVDITRHLRPRFNPETAN